MCIALTMLLCSLEVSANSMVSYPLQSADTTIVIVPDSTSPKPYVVIVDGDTLQPNRLTEDVAYENVLEEERAKQRRVPVNPHCSFCYRQPLLIGEHDRLVRTHCQSHCSLMHPTMICKIPVMDFLNDLWSDQII